MLFNDRTDAGLKLAVKLQDYAKAQDTIVVGLARGGVVVAQAVSEALRLPLDVVVIRKVGAPFNEELAIGAVDEEGHGVRNDDIIAELGISGKYVEEETKRQKEKALQRANLYRKGKKRIDLQGKTVIVVDDGIATGASMKAAIYALRQKGVEKVVLAVPVGAPDSVAELSKMVDETVCLYAPSGFAAVGQFYRSFDQTSDDDVIRILGSK